jgi:hypothetical protein
MGATVQFTSWVENTNHELKEVTNEKGEALGEVVTIIY